MRTNAPPPAALTASAGSVRLALAMFYAAALSTACAIGPLYVAHVVNAPWTADVAQCDTDTDCMRLCPPPADDPDCDGGPQDATHARGDYGTQP